MYRFTSMNRFNEKKKLKLFICYKHLKNFGWIDVFNLKSFLTTGSLFPQQCLDKETKTINVILNPCPRTNVYFEDFLMRKNSP